ncbi:transcription factor 25 [Orussus abietinus]|uniref:transcription factor 25 n=1 Tax=Orussus abietinus TaxID=222816 RepID=UPI000626E549|nr:transcription factor 25 [Orussus abietinus]
MSTRYIRKVYGNDLISKPERGKESDSENSPVAAGDDKNFNVFNLLTEDSVSGSNEDEHTATEQNVVPDETKRKKKKKKRKKPGAPKIQDSPKSKLKDSENEDEIEKMVKEVNKLLGEPTPGTSKENPETSEALKKSKESMFTIQHKHLNPFNELKRMFGSKTVQADQSKRRNRDRIHLKRTWLVSPRDRWLPIGKSGLTMSLDTTETRDGIQYFIYEHTSSYQQAQLKFLQAVESMNPENIINVINMHPYHVDGLLQLSDLYKLSEDLPMAAEQVERALYCLECAFHPLFNVTTATCRLNYRRQQNRALFITLFKHFTFLGGRGCYRTSLEFCKLLLSLDPEGDPLAVVLALDFYALRAGEYEWFIEFCSFWDNARNLTQLPNVAYSLALSHYYLGEREIADELLQNALIMFPGVLFPLLNKCSVQTDTQVTKHEFFTMKATSSTSPALEKLQTLYVARSFPLWKDADILPWLEEQVHVVLARADSSDEFVKFCQEKRSKRYRGNLPRNIVRHIILSDIKEVTVQLQEDYNRPMLSHDPLPPTDSIDLYARPRSGERRNQQSSNILSLFFSSLFVDVEGDVVAAALNGFNLFNENGQNDENA